MLVPHAIPGLICAYRFPANAAPYALNDVDGDTVISEAANETGWVWLHLNLVDKRCARWLTDRLGLPGGAVAAFCDEPSRQYLSEVQDCVIGHLTDFLREFDADSTDTSWCRILLTDRILVTGRVKALQSAERLRREIARGHQFQSPQDMFSLLLSNFPDTLDSALNRLTDELEAIEDHVLDDRHRNERRRLSLVRREAAQLHRHMRAMRRAFVLAERHLHVPESVAHTAARLANLDQDFDSLESRARFFHDEIDAKLAAETNRQLYILSALTSAFLPPALVAGVFGMNMKWLPFTASDWGFWYVIVLCILSSAAVWLYLWWINRA